MGVSFRSVVLSVAASGLALALVGCSSSGGSGASSSGGSQPGGSASASAKPASLTTVRMGLPAMSAFYLPELLGKEKGFFAAQGINLETQIGTPPNLVAGAMSGDIPFDGAIPTAIQAHAVSNTPLTVVFATFGKPMFELFAQKNLTSLDQLSGKSVAVTAPNSADQYVLEAQLAQLGKSAKSYSFVATGGSDLRYKALTSGSVAGAMLSPPFSQMAERQGYVRLTTNADAREIGGSGLAVSSSYLSSHRDVVASMIKAELASMKYIRDHEQETIAVLESQLHMDPSVGTSVYNEIIDSMTPDGKIPDADLTAQLQQIVAAAGGHGSAKPNDVVNYDVLDSVLAGK